MYLLAIFLLWIACSYPLPIFKFRCSSVSDFMRVLYKGWQLLLCYSFPNNFYFTIHFNGHFQFSQRKICMYVSITLFLYLILSYLQLILNSGQRSHAFLVVELFFYCHQILISSSLVSDRKTQKIGNTVFVGLHAQN